MDTEKRGGSRSLSRIPIIANIVLGVLSFYTAVGLYTFAGGLTPLFFTIVGFGLAFFGLAFAVRTGRPVTLIGSVIADLAYVFVIAPVFTFLSEPTAFPPFIFAVSAPPVVLLSVVSSLLSWKETRRTAGASSGAPGKSRASAFLAFAVIGFVAGGLLIGALAARTESTLIANSGTTADVTIVVGAETQGNPLPYSPSPYTIKAGSTVTWVNKDSGTHTVTSFGSNLFDSGNLAPGGTYKWTFTQPGTYQYYCTIHPWMKGTIVVTSG